jgi:hypothetical protein
MSEWELYTVFYSSKPHRCLTSGLITLIWTLAVLLTHMGWPVLWKFGLTLRSCDPEKTILNPNSSRARYVFPKTHLLMQLSLLYIGNLLVLGVLGFRNLITSRTEEVQCQFTDGLVGYPTSFWKFTLLTILGPYRLLYFLVQGSSSAVI